MQSQHATQAEQRVCATREHRLRRALDEQRGAGARV